MHAFLVTSPALTPLAIGDWFALTADDSERAATALLGKRLERPWLRHDGQRVVIAKLKLGSIAEKIPTELNALAAETSRILAGSGTDSALRAAAFYHLRFENIHPLGEGNGRVGRTILAAQIDQTLRIPVEETLHQLNAHENDYKMVFASGNPEIMFELMLDVIARLTGHTVGPEAAKLPASILPLYPDRRPLMRDPEQRLRASGRPNCTAGRSGNPFRKFK